jgi:membrane fusion protein (multidrug efflux system)
MGTLSMNVTLRILAVSASLLLAACGEDTTPARQDGAALPSVITMPVQARDVSTIYDYVGRSEASQRVELRARVTGTLLERPFEEGGKVAAGALMFKIDPAEFEARRDSAQADVAKAEATVEEATKNFERYRDLVARDAASVARFEEAKARDASAKAELAAAKAALKSAELSLGYTEITAPITGWTSRANADVGNIIGPETGILATLVQLDPIRAVFSIGEREYLIYAQRNRAEKADKLKPRIKLADDTLYEHAGTFDMIDNEVDPATGTIAIRVTFPNPDRLLVPGQFVNVVLTSETPNSRIVVPQAAVQENQAGPFVLVVDSESVVEARSIKTGQRIGPDIVALEGLEAGETIIIDGIQKVRPGAKVNPSSAAPRKAANAGAK